MMNKLQQYFPMIRTKEEVLKEIENNSKLKEIYENWQEDEREEFLAFVTGTKGNNIFQCFVHGKKHFTKSSTGQIYDTSFTVGPKKHRMNFLTSLPAQKV